MRTLQVPDRTYRKLLGEVQDFRETEADVIERVLEEVKRCRGEAKEDDTAVASAAGHADAKPPQTHWLRSIGGHLPPGTQLRADYKGEVFEAEVRKGKIVWRGELFKSPTGAAVAAIQSTGTRRSTENGWRFWSEAKLPDENEWRPMNRIRSKAERRYERLYRKPKASTS